MIILNIILLKKFTPGEIHSWRARSGFLRGPADHRAQDVVFKPAGEEAAEDSAHGIGARLVTVWTAGSHSVIKTIPFMFTPHPTVAA